MVANIEESDEGVDRGKVEREERGAEEASAEYAEKTAASEKNFGEKVKGIFDKDNLTKMALLEGLDLLPFLAGYSVADLYVAVEGCLDVYKGVVEKDADRITKGGLKVAVSAVPGLPVAGIGPVLDKLLPNKERPVEDDK
ncbi:hypothetical protein ISR94_03935 [Candidatus Microgenomates bacterium]|nr:hypothetical protein [Candidatus Microgenomates bacterium]